MPAHNAPFTEEEVRAFVGLNAGYYLRQWCAAIDPEMSPYHCAVPTGLGGKHGFNLIAFAFAGLWLPFRKLDDVSTAIFYAASLFLVTLLREAEALGIFLLNAGILCGLWGNSWYLSKARKSISAVRRQGLPADVHLQTIAERGGVSLVTMLPFLLLAWYAPLDPLALTEQAGGARHRTPVTKIP